MSDQARERAEALREFAEMTRDHPNELYYSEAVLALLAEKERLEKSLRWIADASYVGNSYSPHRVIEIYRRWARAALVGDAATGERA